MHISIPLLLPVLRRRWCVGDGGVNYGALGEPHHSGLKMDVDLPEDPLAKGVSLQQMAELADRLFVRDSPPRCPSPCQQTNPWILYRRAPLRLHGR